MAFAEDFTGFFDSDEFGDVITVVATSLTFNAIFDDPSQQHELTPAARQAFSPARGDVEGPQLLMCEADAIAHNLQQGVQLSVLGSLYNVVKKPEGDGTGLVTVFLIKHTPEDTSGSWKL